MVHRKLDRSSRAADLNSIWPRVVRFVLTLPSLTQRRNNGIPFYDGHQAMQYCCLRWHGRAIRPLPVFLVGIW